MHVLIAFESYALSAIMNCGLYFFRLLIDAIANDKQEVHVVNIKKENKSYIVNTDKDDDLDLTLGTCAMQENQEQGEQTSLIEEIQE